MTTMKLMGIDMSLRNLGMVAADVDVDTLGVSVLELSLKETEAKKNKSIRASSHDLASARIFCNAIRAFINTHQINMCVAEMPQGTQSARGMASYGIVIGLLASIDISLIQVTPIEVKLASVGSKTASKREMIEWATENFPHADWKTRKTKGKTRYIDKNEHMADSLAAIHAGLLTDDFANALSFFKELRKHSGSTPIAA